MKKINRIIFLLVTLAVLLRIGYIFTLDNSYIGRWDDQGWAIAKNLVSGHGYQMEYFFDSGLLSFRPPVFPLFLAGLFMIFGQSILVARIFLALINVINCLVIYFLGKEMYNREVGLIAMAISVFYPIFIYWSGHVGPESLITLLLSLSVLYAFKARNLKYRNAILCGLFLGLSVLCRSMILGLIPLIIVWLCLNRKGFGSTFRSATIVIVTFCTIMSPWIVRNYIVHDRLVLTSTEGGITFYCAHNPKMLTVGKRDWCVPREGLEEAKDLSEVDRDKFFYKKGMKFICDNPGVYLKLVFERVIRFWRFYPHLGHGDNVYDRWHAILMFCTDGPLILLALWGLIRLFKTEPKKAALFMFVLLYFTAVSGLIRGSIRYRAPIMPYVILLCSYIVYLKLENEGILKKWREQ